MGGTEADRKLMKQIDDLMVSEMVHVVFGESVEIRESNLACLRHMIRKFIKEAAPQNGELNSLSEQRSRKRL